MLVPSKSRVPGLAAAAVFLLVTGCDDVFVPQDNAVRRALYEEAVEGWTTWVLEIPHSTSSPISDPDGSRCATDQSGAVWNLAGTFGGDVTRTCTVPRGKYLFFPLVNRWRVRRNVDVNDPAEQAALTAVAEPYFAANRAATCALTLKLDGEDLVSDELEELDEELYVDVLDPFVPDINDDNWASQFGAPGGPTLTVADGHFALLRPLSPGEHTLEFGGSLCDEGEVFFETSATYTITIED